jgi:hypothetical protein
MLICYISLIAYFRAAGGYRAERLHAASPPAAAPH